jgi:hypothetical protein
MNTKTLTVLLMVCITITACTVVYITILSNNAEKSVVLEVKEKTITNTELTLIIKNPTLNEYQYSYDDYYLEKFDGSWNGVPYTEAYHRENDGIYRSKIGYHLRALSTVKMEINWNWKYGVVSAGTYRISYQVSGHFYTSAEFTIN